MEQQISEIINQNISRSDTDVTFYSATSDWNENN